MIHMMKPLRAHSSRRRSPWALALALAGVFGCTEPGDDRPLFNPGALVPATGVVTVKGNPLASAVVTFLPDTGCPGVGETDEDGKFVLKSISFRGVTPGDYKVAVSYFATADGTPQGTAARDALVPSQDFVAAKELLPPHYSDFGRTTLRAKVSDEGGTFKFDLDASLPAPKKQAEAQPEDSESEKGAEQKKG
jgi:hypothetical protein